MSRRNLPESPLPSSPLAELEAFIGSEHVLTAADAIAPYCEDWRGRRHGLARAVVRPTNVQEVARIVDWSRRHRVPLVPQGGNTGLVYGGMIALVTFVKPEPREIGEIVPPSKLQK